MHPLRRALPALIVPLCVAATAALSAPAAPVSAAVNTCRATPLPTLGNAHTEVTAGEPSGRYLVGRASDPVPNAEPILHSLIWDRGVPRLLDTEPVRPYVDVRPTGVNQSGTVVGFRMTDNNSFHTDAWSYRDGRFTLLPGLSASDSTEPVAVNSRGDVAGTSQSDDTGWHAVVWPADRPGTVRELTVPGKYGWTFAFDIDEDGTVLGQLGSVPGGTPYVWPASGSPYQLTAPAGLTEVHAKLISNGLVVGGAQRGSTPVGLRWNLASRSVQVVSASYGGALALNRWGTVGIVGALVRSNGQMVPLGRTARPLVVTDRDTAAGNTDPFTGIPVVWTGCWTYRYQPS
ncbi:hypothetical protein [Flindersiella endophytica]